MVIRWLFGQQWHLNKVPRHVNLQVQIYRDPDPVITLKRLVLKHRRVGASFSECGREFHRWQPLFKKESCPATRFTWDGNKPFSACRVAWLCIC